MWDGLWFFVVIFFVVGGFVDLVGCFFWIYESCLWSLVVIGVWESFGIVLFFSVWVWGCCGFL